VWQADDTDSLIDTADVITSLKRCPDTAATLPPTVVEPVVDFDNSFPVHINIERAFHLPMVLENRYHGASHFCS